MNQLRVEEMSDEQLRREVRERRARVAADVEALSEKLTRENLQREAAEAAREMKDHMMSKARHNVRMRADHVREGVRDNPWPYALIAGGIGWLLVDRYVTHGYTPRLDAARMRAHEARQRAAERLRPSSGTPGNPTPGNPTPGDPTPGDPSGRVDRLRHRADASFRDLRAQADARYQRVKHRASLKADDARIAAAQLKDRGGVMARDAGARAQGYYDDHPFAVGSMALALGLGLGLLLPASRREVALIGERSDDLGRRAREVGRELKSDITEIARTTAEKTAETAKETMRAEAHSHRLDEPMAKLGLEGSRHEDASTPAAPKKGDNGEPTSSRSW